MDEYEHGQWIDFQDAYHLDGDPFDDDLGDSDEYDQAVDDFLQCAGCGKHPSQLPEYEGLGFGTRPANCWNEEGTLNRESGEFLCNACYIAAGMPSSPTGWKVGDGYG